MSPARFVLALSALVTSACQSAPVLVPQAPAVCQGAGKDLALPATRAPEVLASGKGQPYQYAVSLPIQHTLEGLAETSTQGGVAVWRVALRSEGAKSLSVHLSGRLPAGGEVWLCGGGVRQGPLLPLASGSLFTPHVKGDSALLEIRAPAALADQVEINLVEAFGGFR